MINDWRPISTALKDDKRTHVLLYFRGSDMTVRVGYWMPSASLSATADGHWYSYAGPIERRGEPNPTHWTPCPAPPL
jgi:hypothetical protein